MNDHLARQILALLDFSIWSILEERVNATSLYSVEDLKRTLLREWERIPDEFVQISADSFVDRLRRCIKVKSDIFEQHLSLRKFIVCRRFSNPCLFRAIKYNRLSRYFQFYNILSE